MSGLLVTLVKVAGHGCHGLTYIPNSALPFRRSSPGRNVPSGLADHLHSATVVDVVAILGTEAFPISLIRDTILEK
jgi:hypothetical protein